MNSDDILNSMNGPLKAGTIWEALDITLKEISPERVVGTMPVNSNTRQQLGYLHGGASVVLAESLASLGTVMNIDSEKQMAFGLEINANHVRSRRDGLVIGEATVLYRGRSNMVWDIKIRDEDGKLVCISRCTVAIVDRPPAQPLDFNSNPA